MPPASSAPVAPSPSPAAAGGDVAASAPSSSLPAKSSSSVSDAFAVRVLGLKYAEDVRTLGLTALYFGMFLYFWLVWPLLWSAGLWSAAGAAHLPAWCFLCFLSFLGAVSTHNCIHAPMFRSRGLNRAWQVVLTLVYGHPVSAYVAGHNLSHHKYVQQRKDVMRTTKLRYKWHLLNGLLFFPIIGLAMVGNDNRYFAAQARLKRPIVRQLRIEQTVLYTIAVALVMWDWRRWIVVAFLPHVWAKFCIITLNLLQHDGCDADSRYNFSRNFTGDWLNWWCFNNGYHTIHHLHPGLHWSLCKERHERDIAPYIAPLLDQPYILTYIWRTFVYPGIRVDWQGNPWTPPPVEPDEPWFVETTETYSTTD